MKKVIFSLLMTVVAVGLSSCGDNAVVDDEVVNDEIVDEVVDDVVHDVVYDDTHDAYFDGTIYYIIKSDDPSKCEAVVAGCSSTAEEMTIPDGVNIDGVVYKVTSIGGWACIRTLSLKSLVISNSIDSIGDLAFAECKNLTSLKIGDNVTALGTGVFDHCESLTQVTLPNSLKRTGDGTFHHCSSLESVKLGDNITRIDFLTFACCNKLSEINLHGQIKTIGSSAFQECDLNTLKIPDSVTEIEEGAFYKNHKLTSVSIGKGLAKFEDHVFASCSSLQTIDVDASNATYSSIDGVMFNKAKTKLLVYPMGRKGEYAIPEGVKEIGYEAFCRALNLSAVSIPNSVATIGDAAFFMCQSLESIVIPNSVESIGKDVF